MMPVQLVPYVAGYSRLFVRPSRNRIGEDFSRTNNKTRRVRPRKQRKERARRHSFIPPSGYKRFNGQTKARIWTTARQRVTTSSSSR
ncbi:hypothetical protein GN244_ATG20126 [Phytophthora infestans]|uniref:Uncharacterized protein n=1 Tax=Phytophthora infestans TaxID=4787 RepID=A0A833SDN2_PHYIN|nr:hypothetical protein GN244_ATG20126 [Phytophthora infestans]